MNGVRTALFVSLAVNLLLVGVVGGAALSNLRHDRAAAQQQVERAPNVRALLDTLPPERAQAVRDTVVKTFREGRASRIAARQARMDVYRLAGADAYDVVAVKAAFARMRSADATVAAQFQDAVADAMAGMTVEERRAVLRELVQRRAGGQGRRPLLRDGPPPAAQDAPSPQP